MAFSMFLRSSVYQHRLFGQQVMRLATHPSIAHRCVASPVTFHSILNKDNKNTPLLNAVRSFRTSGVMRAEEKAHDHSKLWIVEKAVTAAMVPLIPLAIMMPNKIFDAALAILITAHSFWGLEAIAVDYVRASVFGPVIPKIAIALVYLLSAATLGGLFYIITHDIGIGNTVRAVWAIKPNQNA